MFKNLARARRRHELSRIKRKRLDYYGGYVRSLPTPERNRHLGLFANTMPCCSCWMCGNPRRHFGELTLKERQALEAARLHARDEGGE